VILGNLANIETIQKAHPGFAAAFDFLRRTKLGDLPAGRVEIDGARLFAVVNRRDGLGQAGAKLEIHKRYIDIQYSVSQPDVIGWKPTSACRNAGKPFDTEKDAGTFADAPDVWVKIPVGCFGIYFPEDAHAPLGSDGPIDKVIVKVAVDW